MRYLDLYLFLFVSSKSLNMQKGVYKAYANRKDPDQQVKLHNLIIKDFCHTSISKEQYLQ